ncbi:Methylcrotonoyl-CoA carboxylase subunit alpha, mitochondrial [Desmophyllum pertusum]|uniref:Methylcrotonoyl-CoA carboxylase subunit alpha, mitochondrial n=1 Tax=Desmophyllum pertusum TaxID=174260 RepID=A0A9W9YC24_9CNID|nr:Methylcrotonoyl-CoA carboxylase subunit alpha, mitochondrial [Desmophyllum pertusum]
MEFVHVNVHVNGKGHPTFYYLPQVFVESGQSVEEGETLIIMEAMKMEHVIRAPKAGVIEKVLFSAGQSVNRHAQLVQFQEQEQEEKTEDEDEEGPEAE